MMHFLTEKQEVMLHRLARRVRSEEYKQRLAFVQQHGKMLPGCVSICANSQQLYGKLMKLLRRVVPDVKLSFESGRGWHTGDDTQYYYGHFYYVVL